MELKSLRSYNSLFQSLKITTLVVVLACMVITASLSFYFVNLTQNNIQTIWIMNNTGEVKKASHIAQISKIERQFEYKDHVQNFARLWYAYDQFSFKSHIKEGLNYVGACGSNMYKKYKQDDVLRSCQEYNLRVTCEIDSISFDMDSYPARGSCIVRQKFETPVGASNTKFNARFDMIDLSERTDKNAHAVLIENWKIYNQTKID